MIIYNNLISHSPSLEKGASSTSSSPVLLPQIKLQWACHLCSFAKIWGTTTKKWFKLTPHSTPYYGTCFWLAKCEVTFMLHTGKKLRESDSFCVKDIVLCLSNKKKYDFTWTSHLKMWFLVLVCILFLYAVKTKGSDLLGMCLVCYPCHIVNKN